ncbi:MAG: PH domain-containing protein [Lachnospiraceae bacterium]|nr:PH domain-containing protein [Lachnospiraceae bacterium]
MNKNDMNKLETKALWLMLISSAIGAVILTFMIVALSIAINEGLPESAQGPFKLGKTAVLIVIWVFTIISPLIRYERYRYIFSDEEIRVRQGFWWVKTMIVPIERLHQVEMQSGPLDQLFGFSKIIVTTAGGNGVVRFIDTDVAEDLVDKLKKRINSYAIKARDKNPNAFAVKDNVNLSDESNDITKADDTLSTGNSDDLV